MLNGLVDEEAVLSQINRWRLECERDHSSCVPPPSDASLPSRLIDVSDPEYVKLVNTKGQRGRYFCLSHQWGTEGMPVKTTWDTIDSLMAGIAVSRLPPTFRDAVRITRSMGCQYLWIDSLCIIQDDSDDWDAEALEMASIYKNGLLTIAAAAASGPKGGLFPTEAASAPPVDGTPLDLGELRLPYPVFVRRYFPYDVGHLTRQTQSHRLLDRGWVLQERLLSPRVAYFGFSEAAWECRTCRACECEPSLVPYQTARYSPRRPFNPKAAFSQATTAVAGGGGSVSEASQLCSSTGLWHHVVSTYTGLKLTVPTDRFSALGGLASDVAAARSDDGDRYMGGLWRKTFVQDLLWRRRKAGDWHSTSWGDDLDMHNVFGDQGESEFASGVWDGDREEAAVRRTLGAPIAPSWSWASLPARVEYDPAVGSPTLGLVDPGLCKLGAWEEHDSRFSGPAKDGGLTVSIENAFVVLRGKLATAELSRVEQEYRLYRNGRATPFTDPDFTIWTMKSLGIRFCSEVFCFSVADGRVEGHPRMHKVYGLVLKAKGGAKTRSYTRIGMFTQSYDPTTSDKSIFDGIKEEVDISVY